MRHQRNTEGLRNNAQKKRLAAIQRTDAAIKQLIKAGGPVNFQAVAKAGKVSTAWLYNQPALRARILFLRELSQPKQTLLSEQSASDVPKDAINRTLRERIKKLEALNKSLREQLDVAYEQASPGLVNAIEVQKEENHKLRQELVLVTKDLKHAQAEAEHRTSTYRQISQFHEMLQELTQRVINLENQRVINLENQNRPIEKDLHAWYVGRLRGLLAQLQSQD